jgi:hypothetical protein
MSRRLASIPSPGRDSLLKGIPTAGCKRLHHCLAWAHGLIRGDAGPASLLSNPRTRGPAGGAA